VGRQLRDLIRSEHGWLGGLGFAASALTVRDRDQWIGVECAAPKLKPHRKGRDHRYMPTQDKDTQHWIDNLEHAIHVAQTQFKKKLSTLAC
jgi:hypothetical protein